MATRSAIGYKTSEGKIRAIYCHWDGQISHNGRILRTSYTDPAKVEQMVELGDLSTLGAEIAPTPLEGHRMGTTQKGVCVYYGRDGGEGEGDMIATQEFDTVPEFVEDMTHMDCDYFYLFNGQDWLVNEYGEMKNGFPVFDYVEVKILQEIVH